MIRRMVTQGVTPERLANALTVDVSHIIRKMNLLDGICAEAATLLKDKHFSAHLGSVIRKMKPTRQVECIELMVATNNITVAYCQALLAATPSHMLVGEVKPKKVRGVTAEQMAKMEREMVNVEVQFKLIEQSYGQDVLNLVLAKGYLVKLLDNKAVTRFLKQNQHDVLSEFENIVQTVSLESRCVNGSRQQLLGHPSHLPKIFRLLPLHPRTRPAMCQWLPTEILHSQIQRVFMD